MTERPTLAELRARVQKDRHREIGNWPARRWARPSAVYGTWAAVRLGLSAHQVTLAALVVAVASAACFARGTAGCFVLGAALGWLGFWLDHVDGQVARWRRTDGLDGVFLDYIMHHVQTLTLGFGLGHGLASRFRDPSWSLAGFAVAVGWEILSLQNDCRYKAFFQRLKRETGSFRVEGGAGGRPAPPARWPRRGIAAITWPACKLCELHMVLTATLLLAALAVAAPQGWLAAWRVYVLTMAAIAPALAAGRVARAVRRGSVSEEFKRWFQPLAMPAEGLEGPGHAPKEARIHRNHAKPGFGTKRNGRKRNT
jgi:hypothetical protein